ncbi:Putative uncharacterized protein [Moritella viscosa]|uniref:DUF4062 domain-containing protein n=1 Tax=Moritella viscosa TaxID=80854 RepID=UPI000508E9B8|nr:DUF4062 domain-containing protein [Moritella viscosa]CED59178.1 putative uncharacterized protein [Moritella viscosa]SHO00212.1 Putative uncharacterized protein [Moritella viscosa]SHO20247.1 Putative uncharacterized protein [Moritella viscosa]
MNSTKYQVFISSTYSDLEKERESIIKAILEMYHIPIGMEMFSAEDEDQWEIIRRTIEVSDYYILVLGLRYGSKASDGISFTQKEYEYALENKIPVLAFVMDEMVSLSKDKRDDDLTEINNFRKLVLKNSKMAQFWSSKEELIKNVSISLMKQIMQKPAVGWVRGDKVGAEEALFKELTSLSKENRQLREKITDLESRITLKIPMIEMTVELPTVDEKFNEFERLVVPEKIDINDIEGHLREFISNDEIEKYNNGLPTQLAIDQYNSEREKIYKLENYSIPLVIDVSNKGSMKANNVFVDITFPEGVLVYSKGKEFSEAENPLPFSPIEKAYSKYQEQQQEETLRKLNSISSIYDQFTRNDTLSALSMVSNPRLNMSVIRPLNQNWWTILDGNQLTIKLNNLLHTRSRTFDDEYMIVPLVSGCHRIKIEIICEEYEAIDIQTIEIAV